VSHTLRRRLLFVSACVGILVFGIILAILGTVFGLPAMRARVHITLAQQGTLFLLLYLGIFLASVVIGPVIDHLGNKASLLFSSLIIAAAMVVFAAAHSFGMASLAAILLGVGGGGLNTAANVLVSELYAAQRGPMLNLLGIFFGVGAISVPLTASSTKGQINTSQLFIFSAGLVAVCAVWYAVISYPPSKTKQQFSWSELVEVIRYSGIFMLGFILFIESGNEACIAGWTSTYVEAAGYTARVSTLVLATYWGALMVSRLLMAKVLHKFGKAQVVVSAAFLSLGGCMVLLSARSLTMHFVGTALIGFSYAPIFPTTLAIAGDRYTQRTGTVFGFLFSIALIGGMTFPWILGQVSQNLTVRMGMILPALGAVGIIGLSFSALSRERKSLATAKR
jgi:MFS transporter, FHS family, glucose/mannose:H+ symporter